MWIYLDMIIKIFDNGWGQQFPLKQYEQQLTQQLLKHFQSNNDLTVVINSVWYTVEYHNQVMDWLRTNHWDNIVLIAMLDAAIPYPEKYAEFNKPVTGIGYYAGSGAVDFCALFVEKFLIPPPVEQLLDNTHIDTPFMCLMRKPHWHRQKLFRRLVHHDLTKLGMISMGGENGPVLALKTDREHDNLAPNATVEHYGIPNDIVSLGHMSNWARCLVNIVAETFYDINQVGFVSEKIYKPIVGCRPFLVYDPDGGTQWLTDRKFEPYTGDFVDISDLDLKHPQNLAPFLKVLSEQSPNYWKAKLLDLNEKLLYNRQRFYQYVDEQKSIVTQGIPCPI